MAETDISELKRKVGAETDQDLAAFLGVERSAVAQWKRRGHVPEKYHFLYKPTSDADIREAWRNAVRHHVFGHRAHHYWLAAALAVAPSVLFADGQGSAAERGANRERILIRLIGLAMSVTLSDLKKRRCENEADYRALVEALRTVHARAVADLIASPVDD